MSSAKVDINGYPIWYEKFGTGSEIILLIPGAIGTGRTDFLPQLEGPHAFDQDKYTLIAIELAGWGRSRPPERKYNDNVYLSDANIALKLMDILGYKKYSVIGWSEGTKVGLVMCMLTQTRIKCLTICSVFIIVNTKTVAPTLATANTYNWPQEMRDNYLTVYTPEQLQELWDGYIGFCKVYINNFPRGVWTNDLDKIRCPVLIFHGGLDPLCSIEHSLHVEKHIAYSQLHRFPRGSHNCHHKYPGEFKRIIEHFIKECDNYN